MDIYNFTQLILRNSKKLLIAPLIVAVCMYMLTNNQSNAYSTNATVFTAITSSSSLNDLGDSRVDFFATKAAYNNLLSIINSRSIIEETSLRLLSMHLMGDGNNTSEISKESYQELLAIVPNEVMELVDKNDVEKTYENMNFYMNQNETNFLYRLISFDHPHYSYKAISQIKTMQIGSSDIIELSYQSDDAAIAYQTLKILIVVFIKKHSDLKKNQSNVVVEYFEKQLIKSLEELNNAEERLSVFNKSNNIINYYEQTKHISSQQEKIEIKLQDVLMDYNATEAISLKLEEETKSRYGINLRNKEILNLRGSLVAINQKIAEHEVNNDHLIVDTGAFNEMLRVKAELETTLREKIDSLYIYERNSDGITIEKLLNDWLINMIDFESSKARLLAMQNKNNEFKQLYNQFAPLGAQLKRIEREIDIKEKAYLEILHHLGLAKLKLQNEEMMANMKVLDEPFLPINAEPTKRKILISVMGVFTFLLTLLGLVSFELLDKTIKTPQRLAKYAGITVIGAIYKFENEKSEFNDIIRNQNLKPIIETILKQKNTSPNQELLVVQFMSNWNGEGKSFIINHLQKYLQQIGFKVAHMLIDTQSAGNVLEGVNTVSVSISETFNYTSYHELIDKFKILNDYHIVLVEVPALSKQVINPTFLSTAQLSFMVTNANRVWSSSDVFILHNHLEQTHIKPLGILNNTLAHYLEDIVGEMPKKRSAFRVFVKKSILKRIM